MPGGARSVRPLRRLCRKAGLFRKNCREKLRPGRRPASRPVRNRAETMRKTPFRKRRPCCSASERAFFVSSRQSAGPPPRASDNQCVRPGSARRRHAPAAGGTPLRAALPAGTGRSRPTEGRVRPRLFLSFRIGYRALHEKIPFLSASGNGCPRHGGGGRKRTQRILCQGKAPA